MKTRTTSEILLGLLALGLAAGCGKDTAPPPPPPPAQAEKPAEEVLIQTPDGEPAAVLRLGSENVRVTITEGGAQRVLRSRLSERRQRTYNEQGSGTVALVRKNDKDKTFTVRKPDGELLWRVRLRQKITVGDHPEKPAFELRGPHKRAVRTLYKGGDELGTANFESGGTAVEIRDTQGNVVYRGMGEQTSALYGVLLVPDIDPVERYVIMAELLVRQL